MKNIRPTIIGVDDSSSMKKILEKGTANLNVDLTILASAHEAFSYLQSHTPDLLILSIMLPDQNGLTLLQEIRKLPNHSDTQTIFVSSKNYQQDRVIAKKLGALDFISKPMPIKVITEVIMRYTDC